MVCLYSYNCLLIMPWNDCLIQGSVSVKDLSEMTAIKTEDIVATLQQLNLIQYVKGQHVVYAHPKVVEKFLKQVGGDRRGRGDAICVGCMIVVLGAFSARPVCTLLLRATLSTILLHESIYISNSSSSAGWV